MKIFNYLVGKTVRFGKSLFGKSAVKSTQNIFSGSSVRGLRRAEAATFGYAVDSSSVLIAEAGYASSESHPKGVFLCCKMVEAGRCFQHLHSLQTTRQDAALQFYECGYL
jgi:hypothetical protein